MQQPWWQQQQQQQQQKQTTPVKISVQFSALLLVLDALYSAVFFHVSLCTSQPVSQPREHCVSKSSAIVLPFITTTSYNWRALAPSVHTLARSPLMQMRWFYYFFINLFMFYVLVLCVATFFGTTAAAATAVFESMNKTKQNNYGIPFTVVGKLIICAQTEFVCRFHLLAHIFSFCFVLFCTID